MTIRTIYTTPASQLTVSFSTVAFAPVFFTGTLMLARLEAAS